MIIVPQYIEFVEWAQNLYVDLPTLNIPIADSEDNWKQWANRLIDDNKLARVPIPEFFPNWKIWAEYFVDSV